jgi:cell division protein FtsI/penicillin-binding protein 2
VADPKGETSSNFSHMISNKSSRLIKESMKVRGSRIHREKLVSLQKVKKSRFNEDLTDSVSQGVQMKPTLVRDRLF